MISPSVGFNSPIIIFNNVLLPRPFLPIIQIFPLDILTLKFLNNKLPSGK